MEYADAARALAESKDAVTEAIGRLEQIYEERGISDDEKGEIDVVLSAFHHFQLINKKGRFFDQVKYLLKNS